MSSAFDPYYRWLSIPPEDRPPTAYQLLGLRAFESNTEVICDAADRQISHVKRYQLGQYQELSQKILAELTAAKIQLTDPVKKAAYDSTLKPRPVPAVVPSAPTPTIAAPLNSKPKRRTKRNADWVWNILGGGAGLVLLAVFGLWLLERGEGNATTPEVSIQRPLVLQLPESLQAKPGSLLRFQAINANSQWQADEVKFALSRAPEGCQIDAATGEVHWQVGAKVVGDFPIAIRLAAINEKAVDERTITVQVRSDAASPATVNNPVSLPPLNLLIELPSRVEAGQTVQGVIRVDQPQAVPALEFKLKQTPPGSQLNASTGAFLWTPDESAAGNTFTFDFQAQSAGKIVAQKSAKLYVIPEPRGLAVEDLRALAGRGALAHRKQSNSAPTEYPNDQTARGAALYLKTMEVQAQRHKPQTRIEPYGLSVQPHSQTEVVGRDWVMLTGIVPFARQNDLFWSCLNVNAGNAQSNDFFRYLGVIVERAEVRVGYAPEWHPVSNQSLTAEIARWDAWLPDPLDRHLINPLLCSPLPPLLVDRWNPTEVVHPRLPKLSGEALQAQSKAMLQPNGLKPVENLAGERGGELLFRFFDFTVQPNRLYQYRVQLLMENPCVPSESTSPRPTLASAWSTSSSPVHLSPITTVLAGPAEDFSNAEDHVTILLRQWDAQRGLSGANTFDVQRGQTMQFSNVTTLLMDPQVNKPFEQSMNYDADLLLVDFIGGSPLRPRTRIAEPAEILFLTSDGFLLTHSQITDLPAYNDELTRRASLETLKRDLLQDSFKILNP